MEKFEVAILGGGPGGYVAAIRAARLGARVALIEKDQLGGTCLNRGCIPTKAILACIALFEKIGKAESFGISTGQTSIDLGKVIQRKNAVVKKLVKGIEFLLEKNKIEVVRGAGKVVNPGSVRVGSRDLQSRVIILATGSTPACLPGLKFDSDKFLSSDDALDLCQVPAKIDIVGGGVIGIHFAMIYSALGSEVTIYEALSEILPGFDAEIVTGLKRILQRRKVKLLTGTTYSPSQSGGKTLVCIGRTPNLSGLENLKLKMDGQRVWVNKKMETSVPGVYAVGDLVSAKLLAHVASEQGVVAAENALGGQRTFDYDCVPIGLYTQPEVGAVGLPEKEAREKHSNIKVGKFPFSALGISQALGEIEGFVKVIGDGSGKILGVHILGPEANNLIGLATLAIKNKLTTEQLAETFQSHPSFPEGLQEASLSALRKSLHSLSS